MRSFTIGRAFSIPIRLDLTFLLILPILAWFIGSQVELWAGTLDTALGVSLDAARLSDGMTPFVLGTAAAVGLFAGVLLHELGHSVVAMRYGFPIESITLWILGGIAQLSDQPEDWRQELAIAIAGPVVSIVLGVLCYLALVVVPASLDPVRFVLGYLAVMNLALAAFNLLPGFPMDGGRVLRALLARTRSFAQATQIAAEVGKLFAIVLGVVGLFSNFFLILIALFIYVGASGETQRTVMNAAFENVSVRDIMTPADRLHVVEPDASLAELLERMFTERHTGYPVVRGDKVVGMVTLEDAKEVKPVERDAYRVEEVMSTDLHTIAPSSNAMEAFETLQRNRIGRLLVMEGDDLVGLISRTDLLTALQIIRDSGAVSLPTRARPGTGADVPVKQP